MSQDIQDFVNQLQWSIDWEAVDYYHASPEMLFLLKKLKPTPKLKVIVAKHINASAQLEKSFKLTEVESLEKIRVDHRRKVEADIKAFREHFENKMKKSDYNGEPELGRAGYLLFQTRGENLGHLKAGLDEEIKAPHSQIIKSSLEITRKSLDAEDYNINIFARTLKAKIERFEREVSLGVPGAPEMMKAFKPIFAIAEEMSEDEEEKSAKLNSLKKTIVAREETRIATEDETSLKVELERQADELALLECRERFETVREQNTELLDALR